MLVNLLELPRLETALQEMVDAGVVIRRAQPFEILVPFIETIFHSPGPMKYLALQVPVSVFIATLEKETSASPRRVHAPQLFQSDRCYSGARVVVGKAPVGMSLGARVGLRLRRIGRAAS